MDNTKRIELIKSMYITARQFRNAINCNELIPTPQNNFKNKIFPWIVNKSFSCEIYLKLILKVTKNKELKSHNLKVLSKKTGMDINFKNHILKNSFKISDNDFEEYLSTISNAFEDWRYIYEKKDKKIMYGFLNSYCDYLDLYCKKMLLDSFNINVDKELLFI